MLSESEPTYNSLAFIMFLVPLQLIFVYVEMDNEDVGKPVSQYFGVTGDGPKVIIFHTISDSAPFLFGLMFMPFYI